MAIKEDLNNILLEFMMVDLDPVDFQLIINAVGTLQDKAVKYS